MERLVLTLGGACVALLSVAGRAQAYTCLASPPPEGLEARCLSRVVTFNETMGHDARRAALTIALSDWMKGCFPDQPGLIYATEEGEASLERVYERVKDMSGSLPSVRVFAEYTSREYEGGIRTCYEPAGVTFRLSGSEPTFDPEAPIVAEPSSEKIKEAAGAGRRALLAHVPKPSASLRRFMRVLEKMEEHGRDFDDTWYNVQPFFSGDVMNAGACYKEFRAGRGQSCLPAADALAACTRHLAEELIQSHFRDEVSEARFAEILDIKAADIQRSLDHLVQIHAQDSPGALPCPSIASEFMPRVGRLGRQYNSVYGAGQY